ncbi:K+-transporting ATPase ATPase A chain [Alicyclobacillus sacchari]|uniref:Potassium-transporting ATPase potassium-binding subunit n=1 Tax=Alicyclobacillus sacchari TaxID=392010 RepID=A0A4V3HDA3_9BACL|nr:potassium-transporting ATPase subunit KdpA [Alicyclobacillus sacchari]TDY40224.1 K+-transporting ATPase ATPase A chain [Alicyclobacillus sacchari]GMA56974.1 potassium-transporting ATPase potassium-binding subunit [Alicyclobacillus sacchari]
MTCSGTIGILAVVALILALAIPLGGYIYRVFTGQKSFLEPVYAPIERVIYKLVGINPSTDMDWKGYVKVWLLVQFVMAIFVYLIFTLQGRLPLNPDGIKGMSWDLAFNTAASFITNTNWQSYAGEQSMSYLGQMVAITYLQFTSAAAGVVAVIAFIRGIVANKGKTLGNFWVDYIKVHTRILLPLAFIFAVAFVGLGLPETLQGAQIVHTLQGGTQTISRGPVASLEAIKQLGTNGGGYFNANSAHPYEDPRAITTVLEILAMALIPAALIATFGKFIGDRKQAVVLYVFLTGLLLLGAFTIYASETSGNPILQHVLGISGQNMEGKEVRFGESLSSIFTAVTTAFTTGAVNNMHDSLTPLGGMVPIVFMMFNSVFGGIGVGLLNILMFLIIAVFLSGLMVGRTPEIFGKKIEAREIKLATAAMLVHPFVILVPTAIAIVTRAGTSSILNPGLHGFSEVLYAFTSGAANNGSAFAGLNGNTVFYNVAIGLVMLFGRYVSIVAMFAMAGSLVSKSVMPKTVGTLKTNTYSFGAVFLAVVIIVGALTFFPAVAVGPIGEQLQMLAGQVTQ